MLDADYVLRELLQLLHWYLYCNMLKKAVAVSQLTKQSYFFG